MAKTKIKITKEELQKDEVLDFTEQAIFWFRTNLNKILTVLAAVFLVWAVVIFYNQRQEATLRSASDRFYQALQLYEQTLGEHPWATAGRTEGMRRVVEQAEAVIDEYGRTAVARNALFLKGNAYYFAGDEIGSTGNTQEAVRIFTEYEQMVEQRGDAFERAAALLALGYAHENIYLLLTENPDEATQALVAAMNYYSQIEDLQGAGFLRYEAMNARARLLAFQGQAEQAEELYRTVVAERFAAPPEINPDAPESEQNLAALRFLANQFTTGNTARIQLQRLGIDVDAIDEEVVAEILS